MPIQPRDTIAVGFIGLGSDEVSLKQLATMFHRIAIPGISVIPAGPFETPEFVRTRAGLIETGILFDPDLTKLGSNSPEERESALNLLREDADTLLEPSGLSLEQTMAAREDEEKVAELKKLGSQLNPSSFASIDPEKLMGTIQRLTGNMTRMITGRLRKNNLDAYTVIPSYFSPLDQNDESATLHDVLKIAFALPVPAEHVPWQEILDYRNDPESQKQFLMLKDCICDVARGSVRVMQVEETLEYLLNRHRQQLELQQIRTRTIRLEVFVVTTAEVVLNFAGLNLSPAAQSLFSIELRKLALLDGESTSPGSEVAYVMDSSSRFSA